MLYLTISWCYGYKKTLGGSRVLNQKSDIQSPKCAHAYTWGGVGVTGLGLSPKFYFLGGFPFKSKHSYRDVYREAVSLYREEAVSV